MISFFTFNNFQFWLGYPPINDQMIVIIVVVLSSDKDEIAMSSSHPIILGSRFRFPRYGGIHAVRSMTVRGASRGVDVFFGRFHSKSLGGYLSAQSLCGYLSAKSRMCVKKKIIEVY